MADSEAPAAKKGLDSRRMNGRLRRLAASAGVLGPAAFVAGWLTAGAIRPRYSAVQEQISQLARIGAPHRFLMTGAFICFGVTMPVFAPVLDDFLGTRKALTSSVSLAGLATLGVAAVPLSLSGGGTEDVVHGTFATLGYIGMALSPLIGAVAFYRRRRIAAAAVSGLTGVVSAAALASTPFVSSNFGLLQRLGLGVVHAWLVVMAILILDAGDRVKLENLRPATD